MGNNTSLSKQVTIITTRLPFTKEFLTEDMLKSIVYIVMSYRDHKQWCNPQDKFMFELRILVLTALQSKDHDCQGLDPAAIDAVIGIVLFKFDKWYGITKESK